MRRNRTSSDSLELFLDTICNMFGGFVFIMLFVVVSIRSAANDEREAMKATGIQPVSDVEVEALNVEIEKLNAELQNVEKNEKQSRKFVEDLVDPTLLEKYRETLNLLDAAATENETAREIAKRNESAALALENVQVDNERLREELQAAQEKLKDVEEDVKKTLAKRKRTTTPPRLHATDKIEVPVIVKYGRCYFWHEYGSHGERLNDLNDDLTVVDQVFGQALEVEPKPWRGVDLNDPESESKLEKAFRKFDPDMFYIAIVLARDSYAEYNVLASFLKNRNYEIYPVGRGEGKTIFDRGGYGHKTQ